MSNWFLPSPTALLGVVLSALGIYAAVIVCVRAIGLRSFSKMSSFDFAMTIAIGSLIASTLMAPSPPLLQGAVGIASLFAIQFVISWLRNRTDWIERLVDNEPLLLMVGETMLHDNLRRARVTEADVWAKLREANVLHPREVRAVVFETTGDVSVLHGDPDGTPLDPRLLDSVRDRERFTG